MASAMNSEILTVLPVRHVAQVSGPILIALAVLVVCLVGRPTTVRHRKNNAMGVIKVAVDTYDNIAAFLTATGNITGLGAIVYRDAPN